MRKFNIHFSRSTKKINWFSNILQWYEGLPISHCLVEFITPHLDQNYVYHSVIGNGVTFMGREKFDAINEIMETYEVTLGDEDYKVMRNELLRHSGEQYAIMQNLGIFIVDQLRKLGIMKSNPWKSGQNCSELIYRYVIPYICEEDGEYEADLVKPSEIRKILKDSEVKLISSKID